MDLIGQRYALLTVVSRAPNRGAAKRVKAHWNCACDCGGTAVVETSNLRNGHIRSCGCLKRGNQNAVRHGMESSPEYNTWRSMWRRCRNPNAANYALYGGRGITVDPRWQDFRVFLAEVGVRPAKGYSLDRIDTDGPYTRENCRWATASEQARNRRPRAH